jgi:phosphoserine aminotransferase
MVVGSGYGSHKEKQIRIANFPANTDDQIEQLLAAIRQL